MGIQVNQTYGRPITGESVKVAYTGTAGTTTAMPVGTNCVRLVSTTDCFIRIEPNPTAVADDDLYLVSGIPEYFEAHEGDKVSAVQVASGGTIYVTPF